MGIESQSRVSMLVVLATTSEVAGWWRSGGVLQNSDGLCLLIIGFLSAF